MCGRCFRRGPDSAWARQCKECYTKTFVRYDDYTSYWVPAKYLEGHRAWKEHAILGAQKRANKIGKEFGSCLGRW